MSAYPELHDLAWLHEEYEAAIGIRSQHAGFQLKMEGVWPTQSQSVEMSANAASAANRSRKVLARLRRLSHRHQYVLHLAYSTRHWPAEDVREYGKRLVGIVLRGHCPKVEKSKSQRKLWASIQLAEASAAYLKEAK